MELKLHYLKIFFIINDDAGTVTVGNFDNIEGSSITVHSCERIIFAMIYDFSNVEGIDSYQDDYHLGTPVLDHNGNDQITSIGISTSYKGIYKEDLDDNDKYVYTFAVYDHTLNCDDDGSAYDENCVLIEPATCILQYAPYTLPEYNIPSGAKSDHPNMKLAYSDDMINITGFDIKKNGNNNGDGDPEVVHQISIETVVFQNYPLGGTPP